MMIVKKIGAALLAADRWMTKHRGVLGGLLALALSALLAVYNVSSGPLRNLNDIGGWGNRALFIAMTAVVHAAVLIACTLLSRVCFSRVALRQIILTAGLYILLLPINIKSYAFLEALLPMIRAMDAGGPAAAAAFNLSAPARLLVYLITRGPVYDMYMLKLFAIACLLGIALVMMCLADRSGLGIRAEVLLALVVILPQGFMNAACNALPQIACVLLLGVSLMLLFGCDRAYPAAAAAVYGAAVCMSGAALYALPAYLYAIHKGKLTIRQAASAVAVLLAACAVCIAAGMPAGQTLASLFSANLCMPVYASGAPGVMNLIPRAAIEEIPQYAPILRHLAQLDLVTNAQEYYTQAHFEQLSSGFILASLAAYLGVCALCARSRKTTLHRALMLALGAMIFAPGATSACWLAVDVLCLYAILKQPSLRLPACMVLFATAGSAVYPMTEEVLLPMVYAFVLCLLALCMLLDVFPMICKGEECDESR